MIPDPEAFLYAIDSARSSVQFKVRHLGFSKVTGCFNAFQGTLRLDPVRLDTLNVDATMQAASITTRNEERDEHLRSADFLNADAYPTLSFSGNEVSANKGTTVALAGDLTIRDITRPVVLKVKYLGQTHDRQGDQRIAFEARTTINRTHFGLTWNTVLETAGLLVSEEIEIMLAIEAVKQPKAQT